MPRASATARRAREGGAGRVVIGASPGPWRAGPAGSTKNLWRGGERGRKHLEGLEHGILLGGRDAGEDFREHQPLVAAERGQTRAALRSESEDNLRASSTLRRRFT